MQKCKEGDDGKQTLDVRVYPVVSVSTKPLLVHVVEAINQGDRFSDTKPLLGIP